MVRARRTPTMFLYSQISVFWTVTCQSGRCRPYITLNVNSSRKFPKHAYMRVSINSGRYSMYSGIAPNISSVSVQFGPFKDAEENKCIGIARFRAMGAHGAPMGRPGKPMGGPWKAIGNRLVFMGTHCRPGRAYALPPEGPDAHMHCPLEARIA